MVVKSWEPTTSPSHRLDPLLTHLQAPLHQRILRQLHAQIQDGLLRVWLLAGFQVGNHVLDEGGALLRKWGRQCDGTQPLGLAPLCPLLLQLICRSVGQVSRIEAATRRTSGLAICLPTATAKKASLSRLTLCAKPATKFW